jgi:predicted SAM-dependent methyltransferase
MKKNIIEWLVWLFSFLLKDKKINLKEGNVKVNLGCGMEVRSGWYNIDTNPTALLGSKKFTFINRILYNISGASSNYTFEKFDSIIKNAGLHFYDLRRGVPFKDNSVDVIYHSHFLEHLSKQDGENFLKECYRVLKPNGLMRVVMPDLELVIEMYKRGDGEKMLESYFFIPYYYNFSGHKYMYDFKIIKNKLEGIGFKEIIKQTHSSGILPNTNFLNVGNLESLFVECKK